MLGSVLKFFKQQCFLLTHLRENPLAAFRMSQSSNSALLNKGRWGGNLKGPENLHFSHLSPDSCAS